MSGAASNRVKSQPKLTTLCNLPTSLEKKNNRCFPNKTDIELTTHNLNSSLKVTMDVWCNK